MTSYYRDLLKTKLNYLKGSTLSRFAGRIISCYGYRELHLAMYINGSN